MKMPKRTNPFGDTSPMQVKNHVGMKQVNMGVDRTNQMRTVYVNTHKLLFDGARRKVVGTPADRDVTEIQETSQKPSDGQLTLDNLRRFPLEQKVLRSPSKRVEPMATCSSEHHTSVKQRTLTSTGLISMETVDTVEHDKLHCYACNQRLDIKSQKCSFCEKHTCNLCLRRCGRCHQNYCHLCVAVSYDNNEDTLACVSCSA